MAILDQQPHESPPPTFEGASRRRRRGRVVALFATVVLLWPALSYIRALTYPGAAGVGDRTVEWVRDNGGGGLVDLAENWWYAQGPTAPAPIPSSIPGPRVASVPRQPQPAALTALVGAPAISGEGVWVAGPLAPSGTPALYTTFIRPDPRHPSVVAGVARMDPSLLTFHSVPGTLQPVPDPAQPAEVPAVLRPSLVATFNSGFKMADANGGFAVDGHTVVPLRDGAASLIVRADGTATVDRWGSGAGPGVVSVRQNLDLVVEDGQPVPGLGSNADGSWGSAKNQLQYTWRSGVGVDAAGHLIYVGGDSMTLVTLGAALVQAGVVTGMELDIHANKVDFFTYTHDGSRAPQATRLLPGMPGPGDRYLQRDLRDFFVASLR